MVRFYKVTENILKTLIVHLFYYLKGNLIYNINFKRKCIKIISLISLLHVNINYDSASNKKTNS
jgi:hypothetical protein